jgi:hypothetical protein
MEHICVVIYTSEVGEESGAHFRWCVGFLHRHVGTRNNNDMCGDSYIDMWGTPNNDDMCGMPSPSEPMSSLIKLNPGSINLSDQPMSPYMTGLVHQSAIYAARATPLVQRPRSIPRGVGMPVWI